MGTRIVLWRSLVVYAVLSGILSVCQSNSVGADFVAYVTVARRMIAQPSQAITAYWSPLFSWLMVPLLLCGIDDLLAGRIVLLISGAIYLCLIHRLTINVCGSEANTDRLIRMGTMTCSTIQASIWSTYLLDPDLLANAILYFYFCLNSDNEPRSNQSTRALLSGAVAGVCYLSKAYMLPFCLLHFVLSIVLAWFGEEKSGVDQFGVTQWNKSPRRDPLPTGPGQGELKGLLTILWPALQLICRFALGLGIVAGPWIACLSWHAGHFTFSTAGSSNHANVSPIAFKNDPLWNPGLVRDYIFEPNLKPDWSPVQDLTHFQHQMGLILHNSGNCIGLIPAWSIVFLLCNGVMRYRRVSLRLKERSFLVWVTMTIVVYCAGYTTVNLEARYIIPTVIPLLCLASLIMIRGIFVANMTDVVPHNPPDALQSVLSHHNDSTESAGEIPCFKGGWPAVFVVVAVLFTSGGDIYNLVRIATVHPQSVPREKFRIIAEQLGALQAIEGFMACSDWHFGLYVAYATNRLENYWGAPLIEPGKSIVDQLDQKNVTVFLRLVSDSSNRVQVSQQADPFEGHPLWTRLSTIRHSELLPLAVEVYVRH